MVPSLRSKRRRLSFETLEARLAPAANPIVAENQLPGNPQSEWGIAGNGDPTLQGFATNFSVNQGESVGFKINNTTQAPYHIDIYRIGYYQGNGARKVATIPSGQALRINQPAPLYDPTTNLVDAGNWAVAANWSVPADAVSGVYIARMVREDVPDTASHIIFVVRDDDSNSDMLFQTSDTTWQAYNRWGGWSVYGGTNGQRAHKVSYNRPFSTRTDVVNGRDYFFGVEYSMVRYLEANGYNVSYSSGIDSDRYGSELLEHKAFLSVGHDEYWSGDQRANVEAARDAGVNLAFFSGNEVYWKTRWESSIDGSNTPYRTLVTYKETLNDAKIDPSPEWTGTWRDPSFSPPSNGGRPENELTGQIFTVNRGPGGETGTSFQVPYEFASSRFWRNTSVADLSPGQIATLGDQVLGYEWDEDLDNGFRPAGLIRLSSTTQNVPEKLLDVGRTVGPGTATHSLTLYQAPSGALVFGAGTVQWAWGLDGVHDGPQTVPDPAMRQATVNLFADMGIQPATLQAGQQIATPSTDIIPPTSTITSPAAGIEVTAGIPITITGTASESSGGILAGVEVSTDGGLTWRRATGRANWSYTWTPTGTGPATIRARAVDDSGNLETAGSGRTVTVRLAPTSTVGLVAAWGFNEGSGTTVGNAAGSANGGTISGAIWATGQFGGALSFDGINDLVTVPDSSSLDLTNGMTLEAWVKPTALSDYTTVLMKERAGGLSYALYGSDGANNPPVAYVYPGTDRSADGTSVLPLNQWSHLAATYDGSLLRFFVNGTQVGSEAVNGSLVTSTAALRIGGNSVWGEYFKGMIDEVRIYNRALSPTEILTDMSTPIGGTLETTPPTTATITAPSAGATVSGIRTVTASAADGVSVAGVQFFLDGQPLGAEDLVAPYSVSWNTTTVANGSHTLTARVRDVAGNTTMSSGVTVTVANAADTIAPTVNLLNLTGGRPATGALVLKADANDNVGVVGVQFQVNGVNLGAEDTVAPYQALWDSAAGADGTYTIVARVRDAAGNVTVSPAMTVTVDNTAPAVTNRFPAASATGVAANVNVTATFSEDVEPSALTITLKDSANNSVTGLVTYSSATKTVTFNPNSDLALNASYTATVTGVTDLAGNVLTSPVTWSFTTTVVVTNATVFDPAATPAVLSAADPDPVEVGMKFRTDVAGFITGIRFYKGAANTGTHVGHLWDENGNLLATVTFTNESATGWQQANLSTPVAVTANAVYVVSYYAPNGGYSLTGNYFTSAVTNGRLTALAHSEDGNGVYRYVNGGGYPTSSFNASNYWVDVVFSNVLTDSTAPTVAVQSPSAGATDVAVGANVSATFSEAVQSGTVSFTLKTAGGDTVPAAVAYDAASRTVTLDPTAALAPGSTYTATVSGAKDAAENIMSPVTWTFTTLGADTIAPTVVSKTPTAGATGVAPATSITATFNESVVASTITLAVLDQNNNPVAAAISYNDATKTVSAFVQPTDGRPPGCCGTCSHCPLATSTQYTLSLSGAQDQSGNTMEPITWSFTTDEAILGVTVWDGSATPAVASANDGAPIELGVRVRPDKTGYITGLRFYKGQFNTGTHVGRIWSGEGTLLDTVNFANESASGWQQADFASPVRVEAGTTYVVSYYAPNGGYAYTSNYFTSGAGSGVLKALPSDGSGSNGLYLYGIGGGFPTNSFGSTNYWVDAVFSNTFDDLAAPTVTSATPAAGATGVSVSSTVAVNFNEAVQQATISVVLKDAGNNVVPATVTYNAQTNVATLTPSSLLAYATTYTVTVSGVKDTIGNTMTTPVSWSFTTGNAVTNASIWAAGTTPSVLTAADTAAIELGLSFQSELSGFITAIRFYKGTGNTGTHVGHLWDAAGNQLASVTFSNESASGWQTANLSLPVAVTANTPFVVSYYAPNGGYSYDHGYFDGTGVANSPLNALANGENGGNGRYRYGAGGGFPTNSYQSTNYWVDVVFSSSLGDTSAPTLTNSTPASAATGVAPNVNVTATFSEPVQPSSIAVLIQDANGNIVDGSLSYDSASNTVTFNPFSNLSGLKTYSVAVTGAKDAAGNTMSPVSWSFTTKGTWSQSSASDFATGTADGVVVTEEGGGALQLGSTFDESFNGASLDSSWATSSWTSQGGGTTNVAVSAGAISVQGAMVATTATYPGIGVEGRVNFAANPYQHFGLATDLDDVVGRYWAIFSTGGRNDTLYARVNVSGVTQNLELGVLPSGFHNYKILPKPGGVEFYVDDVLRTTVNLTFPAGTPMKVAFSSFNGGAALQADWARVVNFKTTGTFTSTVFDAGSSVSWHRASWTANVPAGATVKVEIRVTDDLNGTWSNYLEVSNGAELSALSGRYVQYRITLTTTEPGVSPIFYDLDLDFI
jgi:methionine-rich copper-binding protein CopC